MAIINALDVGINSDWDDPSIIWVANAGFRSIRIGWEPNWDFSTLQRIVKTAGDNKLLVHLNCVPTKLAGGRTYDDPAMPGFVDKCARLPISSLGFFNEGNHLPFIANPNAAQWADAQVKMKDIAHQANPILTLLLEALSPESGALDPRKFLADGLVHNNRLKEFNAFGAHVYEFPYNPLGKNSWNPAYYLNELDNLWKWYGKVMPFWITEFGAPSGPASSTALYPDAPYKYDEATQLQWFVDYMQAFQKSAAKVTKIMWYNQRDGNPGTGADWEKYLGLLRVDGSEKPICHAMRAVAWSNR